jgi:ATP synthase protein I
VQLTDKSLAYRVILVQLVFTLLASALLLIIGWVHAYSGLAGGIIAVLATAFLTSRLFVRYRAQSPATLVARFYGAELQKLVLTGLLFAATILWLKPLSVGALFGVYLLVQIVPMLVSHLFD